MCVNRHLKVISFTVFMFMAGLLDWIALCCQVFLVCLCVRLWLVSGLRSLTCDWQVSGSFLKIADVSISSRASFAAVCPWTRHRTHTSLNSAHIQALWCVHQTTDLLFWLYFHWNAFLLNFRYCSSGVNSGILQILDCVSALYNTNKPQAIKKAKLKSVHFGHEPGRVPLAHNAIKWAGVGVCVCVHTRAHMCLCVCVYVTSWEEWSLTLITLPRPWDRSILWSLL